MFHINRNTELDSILLGKMLNKFNVKVLPQLKRWERYYNGQQDILNKTYTDASKPCCHIVTNYCKNIADSYTGYMATPGYISYSSQDDITEIMEVLRYNDYQTEDAMLMHNLVVYGTAAELMYFDEQGQGRFKLIEPTTCFGVFDDSLTADLLYFVRFYPEDTWSEHSRTIIEVYDDHEITRYYSNGSNGYPVFLDRRPHYMSQCPAVVVSLFDERSIFDCIISLQDAANELLSSEVDDYAAFCDAFLALTGVDAETDDIAAMKENRVLVLPEGAVANWLTKNSSDTQIENILKRIHDSIYRVSQCPDFSSETFVGGVSSGIAIRYRLTGMESKCGQIEGALKLALQRRIELICGIASLKIGEEVFRDITISFKRNIPEDISNTVATVNQLRGLVSDNTLLGLLPFVSDVNAEAEAVKQQNEENSALYPLQLV